MGQLEKDIEKEIIDYAEACGWWQSKFVAPGKRGVPDRLFLRKGRVIFIEVKKVGEKPTVQQYKRHKELRDHGAEVFWFDSFREARVVLV